MTNHKTMKNLFALALLSFFLVAGLTSTAQTRAEKKALKKELKKYKKMKAPQVKAAFDRIDGMKTELNDCKSETSSLKLSLTEQKDDIKDIQLSLSTKEQELASVKTELDSVTTIIGGGGVHTANGIYFKVQLGAFKKNPIPEAVGRDLIIEKHDGYQKLVKGFYREIANADLVSRWFASLGIRDAWVVCYKAGERVSRDEALSLLSVSLVDLKLIN